MLEPIFEADFLPVSYGFRPKRRAHDAIAEIQRFGTKGYRWVLDADIEACFDSISHAALMDRVRARVKDKRVLALVKSFLKAGILTELGEQETPSPARRREASCPRCWPTSPWRARRARARAMAAGRDDEHSTPTRQTPREGPTELADRPLCR